MAVPSLMFQIVAVSARPKRGRAPRRGSKGENACGRAVAGRIGEMGLGALLPPQVLSLRCQ